MPHAYYCGDPRFGEHNIMANKWEMRVDSIGPLGKRVAQTPVKAFHASWDNSGYGLDDVLHIWQEAQAAIGPTMFANNVDGVDEYFTAQPLQAGDVVMTQDGQTQQITSEVFTLGPFTDVSEWLGVAPGFEDMAQEMQQRSQQPM